MYWVSIHDVLYHNFVPLMVLSCGPSKFSLHISEKTQIFINIALPTPNQVLPLMVLMLGMRGAQRQICGSYESFGILIDN